MKTTKWLLLAGVAILLVTMGCEKQIGFVEPQQGGVRAAALPPLGRTYNLPGNWFLFFYTTPGAYPGTDLPMSIGQDNGATGSFVRVWQDQAAEKMYAEFHTTGNWYIVEAHFDVKLDSASLTHNKQNNLLPGHFPGQTKNAIPYPQVTLVEVDWTGPWSTQLAMAALCKVAQGEIRQDEFGNDYWYYWNFNTGCGGEGSPYKTFALPTDSVYITGDYNFGRSYWLIALTGTGVNGPGQGFNVWDGDWIGWCMDPTKGWLNHLTVPLRVWLWNALDPALPDKYRYSDYPINLNPIHWDRLGYLITKYSGDNWTNWLDPNNFNQYPFMAVQEIVWYELGKGAKPNWEPAKTWVEDMELNGNGWLPHTGDWVPVICAAEEEYQGVFIEVDP